MITSNIFSDKVQESFKWLTNLGYQFKRVDTNILFELAKEDGAFAIGFSWAEYNQILVNGIAAYRRFDVVENVLQKVTKRDIDFTIKESWKGEVPQKLERINDQTHFQNAFFLADTSEVHIFSELVKAFYESDAVDFFTKYDCLESIVEEMESLPSDKKASMIVNTSNSTFLRIMAIKYFIDPIEGEKFYKETIKELDPLKNQKVFGQILQDLESLKSKLNHSA